MSVVRSESRDGVCTVTLCDVEHRNALSNRLVHEMVHAFEAAEADDDVRVIVLTNDGPVFSAGADLSEASSGGGDGDGMPPAIGPMQLFGRFARSPKPYVGRIAGHCVAGGMGLAAAMDVSIAVEDVTFGFTEVRVGVAPAVVSVVCLPKLRTADARAVFLRGNRFSGREAAEIGLVNAAVPAAGLDADIDATVSDLLAAAPGAIAATKELLRRVPHMRTDEAYAWTSELSAQLFNSAEAREGMTAFLEKRSPSFSRHRQAPS